MMLDMMIVLRIPRMAHQRFQNVWGNEIEETVVFGEYTIIVDVVMQQECER